MSWILVLEAIGLVGIGIAVGVALVVWIDSKAGPWR